MECDPSYIKILIVWKITMEWVNLKAIPSWKIRLEYL